jgi:drug/metabolite transporter (DMT)-like permease
MQHMQTRSGTGTFFCLASGAAFGAMAIFAKLAYKQGATVATVLSFRFILAAALFWLLALAGGHLGELRSLTRRQIRAGLLLGACGYAIQSGCYFTALTHIDASLLSLLLYTFPAMVAGAAVLIGRERMDARRLTALSLASGGLVLVLAGAGAGQLEAVGVALGLGAAVVYSTYILVSDRVVGGISAIPLSALVCSGAAVSLTVGSTALGQLHPGAVSLAGWAWLASIAVVSTVAAIGLFFAGLRLAGPTTASILATVEPLVTVLLAFLVFGETLGPVQIAGGVLVLSAVLVLRLRPVRAIRSREAWAES